MKKTRVNAPCPCGSGRKYKRCCMNKGETVGSRIPSAPDALFSESHTCFFDDIDLLCNSVIKLIEDNRLDEAEKLCMRLQAEYPDDVDGLETAVLIHKARKNYRQAAAYAMEAVAFMSARKEMYSEEMIRDFEVEAQELLRLSEETAAD